MALAYRPPGVTVDELVSPSVSPLLAVPASVAIIGMSQGFIERTDLVQMTGTVAQALPNLPTGASVAAITAVVDTVDPSKAGTASGNYTVTTDYTVDLTAKTITRVNGGNIPDGRIVSVTYQYLPADYFDPILLDNLGSIANRFGPAWKNGAIFSELTYAASISFENGARFVVCQPLFKRATQGDPSTAKGQPTSASAATAGAQANPGTWADTFYSLRDIEDVNVFVPVVGQRTSTNINDAQWLAIAQTAQDHLKWIRDNDQYGVILIAEDGSDATGSYAAKATIRTHGTTLAARYGGSTARQTVLLNTAKFVRPRPDALGSTITVGGQYMAAALAGMLASRPVQQALTGSQVSGFSSVADYRSRQDMNDDAGGGLLVLHQRGAGIFVRHGLTLDTTAAQYSELSVVRGQHYMIESLRQTVDVQIIGKVIADAEAPLTVRSAIIGVLEMLRGDKAIVDYANVAVRQLTLQPTTIEVRFSYKPSFTVNYVNIAFSIDLTANGLSQITNATQV